MNHEKYMQQLLEFTRANSPNIPYTASIVDRQGHVLCYGIAQPHISPTYHAEMVAINECARLHPRINWSELTMYSTGEPCSMCASAVCWANFHTVVYATDIPLMAKLWSIESTIRAHEIINTYPKQPQLIAGVCATESDLLFSEYKERFLKHWQDHCWDPTQQTNTAIVL